MKKRIASIALIVLMLLNLASGLAENEGAGEAPFKPALDTERTARFSIIGHLDNFEALEAVITGFTRYYPNVTVAYEKVGNYTDMVELRLENDPTVGIFMDGPMEFCEDLTAHDLDISAFGPAISAGMHDGRLYSVPLGIDVRGFVVNVSLLEKEGLEIPANYGQFVAVCDALVEKGYTPIQQRKDALSRFIFENMMWDIIAGAEDTEALIAQLASGEEGSYECMRPIYEMMTSFFEKGYTSRAINETITDYYNQAILKFFEGDMPFLPGNIDTISGMKKRESKSEAFMAAPFTYRFMYVPLDEEGVYAEQSAWRKLSVNKNAEEKEMALEFMRFLMRKDSLDMLAQVKGIPSASNEQTDPRFTALNDFQGRAVYTWEYEVAAVLLNSVIGRLTEYAGGEIATIDEAIRLIEADVVK